MLNINKLFKSANKKSSILIIVASLVIIGLMSIVIYKSKLSKTQAEISKNQGLDELIVQLDKTIESIKKKSAINVLDTAEAKGISSLDEVSISGIICSPDMPLAFVNGKLVGLGAEIEGFQVVDIKEESVTIKNKQGQEKTIYLYE